MTASLHPPRRDRAPLAGADEIARIPRLPRPPAPSRPRVVAVLSGKGGVGKTNIVANLAVQLGSRGLRVLAVDGDVGLANLELLLGLDAHTTSADVVASVADIDQALLPAAYNAWFLPASTQRGTTTCDEGWRRSLITAINSLEDQFDAVLVDTGAGLGENTTGFAAAAQDVLVVVSPEPTGLSDAYGTIRTLSLKNRLTDVMILPNQVEDDAEGLRTVERLGAMCSHLTDVRLHSLGAIPFDPLVRRAGMRQEAFSLAYPSSPASRALDRATSRYLDSPPVGRRHADSNIFPRRLMRHTTPNTQALAGARR